MTHSEPATHQQLAALLEAEAQAVTAQQGVSLPTVDLASLLCEMTALKAEVRAETQSAREVREQAARLVERLTADQGRMANENARLQADLVAKRREGTRRTARILIDFADRLEVTLASAQNLARPRGLWPWRRIPAAAFALVTGLELTLARLSGALTDLGVRRLTTLGTPWDSKTMEVVATVDRGKAPDGAVVEEVQAGYVDEDGVVRIAQVIVRSFPTK